MPLLYFKLLGSAIGAKSGSVEVRYAISIGNPVGYGKINGASKFSNGEVEFSIDVPTNQNSYSIYLQVNYANRNYNLSPVGISSIRDKAYYSKGAHVITIK